MKAVHEQNSIFLFFISLIFTPMGTVVAFCSIVASLLIAANQFDQMKVRVNEKYAGDWKAYGHFLFPWIKKITFKKLK